MYQIRKTTISAAAGLAALGLLAAPALGVGISPTLPEDAIFQPVHMSEGQGYGMGYGMMGPGYGMGPGMMGQYQGYGMGPGMMGPYQGYGMSPGYGGQQMMGRDLTADDVRHMLEHRLQWNGNERLKVGEVQEVDGDTIMADIVTVDGSLVDRFRIDRHTGVFERAK